MSRASAPALAKDAGQSRAGVRYWRLHTKRQKLRCNDLRVLRGGRLLYVARTRNGFTPVRGSNCSRRCGSWRSHNVRSRTFLRRRAEDGVQGLTAAKMAECRWLLCRIRHRDHNVNARLCRMRFRGSDSGSSARRCASTALTRMRHSP